MHVVIKWHRDQFNVALCSKEGKEPFLEIKGARIVNGRNGEFVSWPSRKKDDGTYWNHVYASEAFGQVVLEEARKTMPQQDTRTQGQRRQPARDELDDDIPF